ncbi:Nn.00g115440.m01.CDS01 [Neocucurbitaria sp. VM-36]
MATSTGASSLKGDAAPFVPGRHEHESSAPGSEPQALYSCAPEPKPYFGQQQYPPFSSYQPLHHDYPSEVYYPAHHYYPDPRDYPDHSCYYPDHGYYHPGPGDYYPQAATLWYPPNAIYIHPMDPFAAQLHEVEGARIGSGMQYRDNNYQNGYEGGNTYTRGTVKTRKAYKRGSWRGKKYREGRREKRVAEQGGMAESGEAGERDDGGFGGRNEGLRSYW